MRQDASADHRRLAAMLPDRLLDTRNPVPGRYGIIVDIGDIGALRRPGAGIPCVADARLFDPQQSGIGDVRHQTLQLRRNVAGRRAIDDQDVERISPDSLLPQPLETVADVVGTVVGADAGCNVHARKLTARALRNAYHPAPKEAG
jgi:hypothetical protein